MLRWILSRNLTWRLSGLTYPTAVIATRGHYLGLSEYLEESRQQMALLPARPEKSSIVLEFGCGLGGNLVCLHKDIGRGFGIDVNRGFLRIARRIARRTGAANLNFISFSGDTLPELPVFNLVFSIGVFERLPKNLVASYIEQLTNVLAPDGVMALYFLTERARGTSFTRRLGERSYYFWDEYDVQALSQRAGLSVESSTQWSGAGGPVSVADMYVLSRSHR